MKPISTVETTVLDSLVEAPTPAVPPGPLVGECVDDRHPTLTGRVLVRLTGEQGSMVETWVPTLQGISVRPRDRVLLLRAENWAELAVIGVIDGFSRRPPVTEIDAAKIQLRAGERVRIESKDGVPLVDVVQGAAGPVLKILSTDVDLELPGALRVRADSIELVARAGEVRVDATDDVIVKGETIQLN